MPRWARYPKIAENTSKFSGVDGEWVATEKVHGANFSVIVSDDAVAFASRGHILADGDNFFGYRSIAEHITRSAILVRERLITMGTAESEHSIVVYGELAGGLYPHADTAQIGTIPVQRGCYYAPGLVFIAFDVALGSDAVEALRFLDFDDARAVATTCGLTFAEPLSRGTLAQCLAQPVRFVSRIPASLGLPLLADNWAEGVVIRPVRELAVSYTGGGRRMLKVKIPEFSEKQYGNTDWREARGGGGKGGAKGEGSIAHLASVEMTLRYELLAAVNEQRLESVLSKHGRIEATDRQACRRLLEDFKRDVEEALVEDGLLEAVGSLRSRHAELHQDLDNASRRVITAFLRAELRQSTSTSVGGDSSPDAGRHPQSNPRSSSTHTTRRRPARRDSVSET